MSEGKRKRMSMLDGLAASGAPAPPSPSPSDVSMMSQNRALRAARDAVDGHSVWELDPAQIDDARVTDRLDAGDVDDLRDAIEANGQTVPILVRRNPDDPDRYLLVYGRRRLEAIRSSNAVDKVRALVASLDDAAATRAQISENMARRDLSFIEKALFARRLLDAGYGNQSEIAEVLTVGKSAISMALTIVEMVGFELATAIGPAHGIGRPRWEALGRAVAEREDRRADLIEVARRAHDMAVVDRLTDAEADADPSVAAFEAVTAALPRPSEPASDAGRKRPVADARVVAVDGRRTGTVRRTARALRLEIDGGAFADWLDAHADVVLADLHASWKRAEER